ncbi:unnamed protein product [Camellia sinensis]
MTRYNGYIINGIRFCTQDCDMYRKTQNSGVVMKGDHKGKPIDFYGVIREIIELKYLGGNSVFLFKCDWWDVGNEKIGIKVDEFNYISVNVTKTWYKDEPFVLACQAEQAFYLKDMKWSNNYRAVQRVLPRAIYDILVKEDEEEEEAEEEEEDKDKDKDEPYQQFDSYGLGDVVHIDDQPIELCKEDMEMICVDITGEFHEEELEVDDEVLINDNNADDDDTNMDDQVDDDMIDDDMDLADFRMGINPGPPIMSREEFETRKANLWRKRATESVAAKCTCPCTCSYCRKGPQEDKCKVSVQKGKTLELVKEVPLDPMAEKLRQERGRGWGGYVPNKLAATSFASTSTQSISSFTSKFMPPTTSASTSAAASASASMHEVTSQSSYLDTSSTDCCIADTTERKKGRGKSRSLALLKIKSQGKRLDVEICRITGNPLGPWSEKFTTELGIEGFIFSNEPYAIASIIGMMKLRYKTYRFNLRQHFRSFPTMESALANPHKDIEEEVWRYLCQLWDDKTYQVIVEHTCNALAHTWAADNATAAAVAEATAMHEKCQKNKENRFELKVLHTAGSRAFRKVQYDEDTNYKGFDRETRMERSLDLHKKLKERENEAIEDGSSPLSDEQLSIEVFGRKSGYISGLGRGPKPSITASGRRTCAALEIENEETRRELEEQRRINEELNARVHNLESNSVEVNAKIDLGCPKGVTPKYSLKPLVPRLSDIKPDIDVEKMFF